MHKQVKYFAMMISFSFLFLSAFCVYWYEIDYWTVKQRLGQLSALNVLVLN